MANNIQIVGQILTQQQVSRYSETDLNLLNPLLLREDFGQPNDYIEYFVYDIVDNPLYANYNYQNFKSPTGSFVTPTGSLPIIEIDPVKDLQTLGYQSGEFKVQYNFFNNKISNAEQAGLFLKEISADRTELRLGSTTLTNEQIETGSLALINEISSSLYAVNYIANFENNNQAIVVNVALNKVESGYEVLLKLYEPLATNITEKSTLWIVEEKINPYVFDINLDKLITIPPGPQLRGPNFSIDIPNQNNVATSYQNLDTLVKDFQSVSTASYQQLLSIITSQSIDINTDYSDFNNFIFFSSAESRVKNFYTKVKQIENYRNNIAVYTPLTASNPSVINDYNLATASIDNVITNFDGLEYYLYFESGSALTSSFEYGLTPYPKSNNTLPYTLLSTSSALVNSWYHFTTASANDYDDQNQNNLTFTVPAFIKDDENNEQYLTFLKMVGNYFDNVWVFLQAITDINLANNNLEKGVSKDLVYYVLQSLGTKLYNQYGDIDNVDYLIGSSGSANWDNNFTYTGSYLNAIARKDLVAESYKRIYHNLPLLLKTKGTTYGLQTLVSTFGITGSTLQVREYGGNLKSNTLDEFNSNKIRVVSSAITGSVLSPFISLQVQPTSSNSFRTNDLNYVDISFSPQDKIDEFASASIVAVNPNWKIDNYIGDPRQQYSTLYTDLNVQRDIYYSPLTASILPYTASSASGSIGATSYNDFIRLVQFFDNSLFKMLQDFVPARTSLSTGVTISSPLLQRNKWVLSNPSSTTDINVEEGKIDAIQIQSEYTDIYKGLSGNKLPYYAGNFTGSYIDTYAYFEANNYNPYLFPTAALSAGDINVFNHTDYNVMLNNVSQSVVSRTRQDIEYVFGTTKSILSPAELQDSYETLRTHQLSRYEGSKIYSLQYNIYTPATGSYGGDVSYGKTAVIDKNAIKLGLFTEVTNNKFLPGRNNAVLKYLVDIEGNLTELNLRNRRWQEIQNTFIAGDTGSVSQFNNQLYSNQKITDGEKLIFDSGYTYNPILYFGDTGSMGGDELAFLDLGGTNAYLSTAQNTLGPNAYISGSGPGVDAYPLSGGYVVDIFDRTIEGGTYFQSGALQHFPSYSVQETGNHSIAINLPFTYEVSTSPVNEATWSLEVWVSGSTRNEILYQDRQFFVAGDPVTSTLTFDYYSGEFVFYLSSTIPSTNVTIGAGAQVYGYADTEFCNTRDSTEIDTLISPAIITAGTNTVNVPGSNPLTGASIVFKRSNGMVVNGQFVTNGQIITIGGTQVTIQIYNGCESYI
jgi:hypothetical protein